MTCVASIVNRRLQRLPPLILQKYPDLNKVCERAEEELGRVKKQLEDNQGMSKPFVELSANE